MTKQKLNKILENHKHWLYEDCDGWEKMCANLTSANLVNANLTGADLTEANLTDANLSDVNLKDANLAGANLRYAKNVPFIPLACPDTGTFTAYKRAGRYIIKLQIPEDAKRLSATSRKCRCNKAKVLEIQNLDGTIADVIKVKSNFDGTFIYEVGKTVSVDNFDENRWNECSTGIHFFINRQEAVQY